MLYLVPNLASCITFVKFNVKFDIALEKAFYAKMSNFGIGTQIWHCIEDALSGFLSSHSKSFMQILVELECLVVGR